MGRGLNGTENAQRISKVRRNPRKQSSLTKAAEECEFWPPEKGLRAPRHAWRSFLILSEVSVLYLDPFSSIRTSERVVES